MFNLAVGQSSNILERRSPLKVLPLHLRGFTDPCGPLPRAGNAHRRGWPRAGTGTIRRRGTGYTYYQSTPWLRGFTFPALVRASAPASEALMFLQLLIPVLPIGRFLGK